MSSIENMIAWMQARKGKVTYSMTSRMGPNSYDCSSSVFFAMIAGGFLSAGSGSANTDSKPQMVTLNVDGQFGNATAKRLQEYFDTDGKDGVISHQYKQTFNQNIYAAQFDSSLTGSNVVKALQRFLGIGQDGLFGQGTIKALQKHLGTTQDGTISQVSDSVRELQRRLNANKL
ncbi:peptidoglycan amidohydrolase family protein [Lactococcus lactis]|uniref:Lysin n=1 Tax=Lactococcus lactis subsp. lactis TaxID=1360 RepID=A0A2N5WAN5_LACLL|nr:peptidoglycan amidohydrolase family protein [Lactococcus lactis]MBU5242834.1 peptidoglycan endopeptidase [Lactococcus lactis]MDT2856694.1 peptidoglycan amidohydrolase family protein [Lactococcus lactis]PLW59301.1 Lysin [Lactococcus lactis subsp. lactis]